MKNKFSKVIFLVVMLLMIVSIIGYKVYANSFTVTSVVTHGNGTITPASISTGSTATFTLNPSSGYGPIIPTTVAGDCNPGTLSYNSSTKAITYTTGTVSAACNARITFVSLVVTSKSANNNGSIAPNGTQTVNAGSTPTFKLTPMSGYAPYALLQTDPGVTDCPIINSMGIGPFVNNGDGTFNYTTPPIISPCTVDIVYSVTSCPSPSATRYPDGSIECNTGTRMCGNGPFPGAYCVANVGPDLGCGPQAGCSCAVTSLTADNASPSDTTPVNLSFTLASMFTPTSWTLSANGSTITSGTGSGTYQIPSVATPTTYLLNCGSTAQQITINPTYMVTTVATPTAGGTISSTVSGINYNQTASITVTANTGYTTSSISGCGGTTVTNPTSPYTYTTGPVTTDCTVTATFSASTSAITVPANSSIQAGGNIRATWSNIPNPSQNNELRLFGWDSVYNTYDYVNSEYLSSSSGVSCPTASTTSALASGNCLFTIPSSALNIIGVPSSDTFEFVVAPVGSPYPTVIATSNTFTVTAPSVNGVCGLTHYLCSSGTSVNNVNGTTAYTWDCDGSNGGTNAIGCSEPKGIIIPSVTTTACQNVNITSTDAESGGTITSTGGATITQSGIVWGTSANPTYVPGNTTNQTTDGINDGSAIAGASWSDNMGDAPTTPLTPGTLYHARSYAINSVGTGYGNDVQCTTLSAVTMTGTLTGLGCTIASGASTCTTNISWSVTNPITVGGSQVTSSYPNTGTVVYSGDTGSNKSVTIPYPNRTFYLYNTNQSLVPTSQSPNGSGLVINATCTSGTSWDGVSDTCKTSSGSFSISIPPSITVQAGNNITVTWGDNTFPDPSLTNVLSDQIRLFKIGSHSYLDYNYVITCTKTEPTAGAASGTCSFTVPSSAPSGNYDFQLVFSKMGLSLATTSNTFTVIASSAPDLTAGVVTPTTATTNVAQAYTATISNIGNISTGTSFPYFFQTATAPSGGGTVTDQTYSTMTTLAAGGTGTATSPLITFTVAGAYSVRVCANKTDSSHFGSVVESNYANNCGAWTSVVVSGGTLIYAPDLTAGVVTPTTATTNVAQAYTATISNIGNISTGTSFPYFFQTSTNGGTTATDQTPSSTMNALVGSGSGTATSPLITFTVAGAYSVRVCANKTDSSHFGSVVESNYANNCGAWTSVVASAPLPPTLSVSLSASPNPVTLTKANPTGTTILTWTTTGLITNCTDNWNENNPNVNGGSKTITGLTEGTYTYTITCSKPGVSQTSPVTVIVGTVGSAGQCSSPQVHYNCLSGTALNEVSSPSKWTWTCAGTDTNMNASCSEKKTPGYKEN